MKKLLLVALALLALSGAAKADCYAPPMPYCPPVTTVRVTYTWRSAFWDDGRWFPAGWYRWVRTRQCWFRKGFGYTHGFSCEQEVTVIEE